MSQSRTIEFWREVRELVERGLSLKKASKQFGLSYSNLSQRAAIEGWKLVWRGRPRTMDLPDGTRRVEMAKEQAHRDARQAELLLEARVAVFDAKKAELVAQNILAQHSTRMKVALSELVVQTAEDLRSPDVRPKDRAMAMVALKTVCDRLFGWDREPDMCAMKLARTSNQSQVKSYYEHWRDGTTPPEMPQSLVNPALIATTPEQLAEMAKANGYRGGQWGAPATECNDLSVGPSAVAPEQPRAAPLGSPTPKKETPLFPVNQPVQSRRETTVEPHPPLSPQERRRQELEELARLRAEWRGGLNPST